MAREFKGQTVEHAVVTKSVLLGHSGPLFHKIQASFSPVDRDGNPLRPDGTHFRPVFSTQGVYVGK